MNVMPAEFDWRSCCLRVESDVRNLCEELDILTAEFYRTEFFRLPHNFPNAHYGYLMACMSKVDLLSLCSDAGGGGQTRRMVRFLEAYMHPGRREENELLVQMFRHTLMHTGELRFIADRRRGYVYTWSIGFGERDGISAHYRIEDVEMLHHEQLLAVAAQAMPGMTVVKTRCMHLLLSKLAHDVERAATSFMGDVRGSAELQNRMVEVYRGVALQAVN